MKYFKIYFLLLFLLAGFSCKKKEYPKSEIVEESVYYSKFDVNGSTQELKAGQNNYYMYSGVTKDSNNVTNYTAELRKADCDNCPLRLKIQINDFQITPDLNSSKIDSALTARKYEFLGKNKGSSFSVTFSSEFKSTSSANGSDYQWSFGDGQTATGPNPTHTFTAAGKYQTCLTVKALNQCQSSICNTQSINKSGFRTNINAVAVSQNLVNFSHTTVGGKAPYNFYWSLGDSDSIYSAETVSHNYLYAGSYPAKLVVIDALGDTATARYNVVTKSDLSSCASNFRILTFNEISFAQQTLSKVNVSWTNDQGTTFHSREATQPSTSFFEVVSVQEGETNEKGQHTKKLIVRFNCKVSNGAHIMSIDNAEAIICVAY